eukprot:gene16409-22620_t
MSRLMFETLATFLYILLLCPGQKLSDPGAVRASMSRLMFETLATFLYILLLCPGQKLSDPGAVRASMSRLMFETLATFLYILLLCPGQKLSDPGAVRASMSRLMFETLATFLYILLLCPGQKLSDPGAVRASMSRLMFETLATFLYILLLCPGQKLSDPGAVRASMSRLMFETLATFLSICYYAQARKLSDPGALGASHAPADGQKLLEPGAVRAFMRQLGQKLSDPGAVRAFRCQLPRQNPFYAFEPASDSDKIPPALPRGHNQFYAYEPASDSDKIPPALLEAERPSISRDPWQVAEAETNAPEAERPSISRDPWRVAEAETGVPIPQASTSGRCATGGKKKRKKKAKKGGPKPPSAPGGIEEGQAGADGAGEDGKDVKVAASEASESQAEASESQAKAFESQAEVSESQGEASESQAEADNVDAEFGYGQDEGADDAGGVPDASGSAAGGIDVQIYPEKELVVEPEADYLEEEEAGEGRDEHINQLIKAYQEKVIAEGELDENELPAEVLDEVEGTVNEEGRHFVLFQAKTGAAPDQCLRYCFEAGASPLWPSPHNIPASNAILPCGLCGKPRQFEFQVLPQLLNYLDVDAEDPMALDWGSIAVYSCVDSCATPACSTSEPGSAYMEEFVWVQPSL